MQIRQFQEVDANEVSDLIAKTLRTHIQNPAQTIFLRDG